MQLLTNSLLLIGLLTSSVTTAFTPATHARPVTKLNVATTAPPSIADMERGVGGRIEEAFAAAKEKGEAAFVTFVTAGYPTKEGVLKRKKRIF